MAKIRNFLIRTAFPLLFLFFAQRANSPSNPTVTGGRRPPFVTKSCRLSQKLAKADGAAYLCPQKNSRKPKI